MWMLPWTGFALVALYAGYVAYEAAQAREAAARAPALGPDPVLELEQINTELSRLVTQGRMSLESARDAMRKGLEG